MQTDNPVRVSLRDLLLVLPVAVMTLACLMLASGVGLHWLLLPTAWGASAVALRLTTGNPAASLLIASIIIALMALASLIVNQVLLDVFIDSNGYHLPAISALANGWNPYLQPDICAWDDFYCTSINLWINHYPKAVWYWASSFVMLTGDIDAAAVPNTLILAATLLVSLDVWRYLGFSGSGRLLLAACAAFNPVVIYQLHSSYVDGFLASTITLYTLLLVAWSWHGNRGWLLRAALLAPLLVNIKFTGLVYLVPITIGALTARAWRNRSASCLWNPMKVLAMTTIAGVFLLGYNPYVSNLVEKKNMFYPAIKAGETRNVIQYQASTEFRALDRFSRLLVSNFSNSTPGNWKEPEFALPLTKFKWRAQTGPRFSGFGPFFSLVLFVCLIQLAWLRSPFWGIWITALLVSVVITSEGWWARLAPQLWLVATLIQAAIMQRGHRVIAWATCTLLLISSLGYAFTVYPRQWQAAQRYYSDLQVVQERNTGTMALILGKEQKAGVLLRLKNDNLYPQVSRESCAGSATNAFFVVCEEDYQTPDTGIAWIRASWK